MRRDRCGAQQFPGGLGVSLQFQREAFDSFYPEALPLLALHKNEISAYPDIELNVDVERYREMETCDILRIYTARMPLEERGLSNGNELVGYAVFLVAPNPHYAESLQAVQDVLYVSPCHRGGRAGIGLVRFSEVQLLKEDVVVIYHHVKKKHPMLGKLLAKEGYEPIEDIFAKRIG
jgi:hypothetical protein